MRKLLVIFFTLVVSAHAVNHTVISLTDGTITWGGTVNGNRVVSWTTSGGAATSWSDPMVSDAIGHWAFQCVSNSAGMYWVDVLTNGNNFIGEGAFWNDADVATYSNSYKFEGYNWQSWLDCPDLNVPENVTNDFTVSFWLYYGAGWEKGSMLRWGDSAVTTNRAFWLYDDGANFEWYVYDSKAGNAYRKYEGTDPAASAWTHVALTWSNGVCRADYNGVAQTNYVLTTVGTPTQIWNTITAPMRVGKNAADAHSSWRCGYVFSDSMSTEQVASVVANGRFDIDTAWPVEAYVDLRETMYTNAIYFIDNSGTGNHIRSGDGPTIMPTIEIAGTAVNTENGSHRAMSFDGVDDYISIDDLVGDQVDGLGGATFAFWVRSTRIDGHEIYLGSRGGTSISLFNCNTVATNYTYRWGMHGGDITLNTPANSYITNQWIHLATTMTNNGVGSGVLLGYIDGVCVSGTTNAALDTIDISDNIKLGFDDNNPANKMTGKMMDFRIYKRCLDASEILQLADPTLGTNTIEDLTYEM